MKKVKIILPLVCLLLSIAGFSHSLIIMAKAYLAEVFIQQAWQSTLKENKNTKPWQWADTWPVAELRFEQHNKSIIVLSGLSGTTLAFGPGLSDASKNFTEKGTKIIGGHRDTHFKFLQNLKVGETFQATNAKNEKTTYQINEISIVDIREGDWQFDPTQNQIHFITCFPFDNPVPGGPLRYIVIAEQYPAKHVN